MSSLDTVTERQVTRAVTEAGDGVPGSSWLTGPPPQPAPTWSRGWRRAGWWRWVRTTGCGPTPATAPCSREKPPRRRRRVIRQFRPARRVILAALRSRPRALLVLLGWSSVEALPALLAGHLTARAVDDGFLAGQAGVGFGFLAALGGAVVVGGYGTDRTHRALAGLVEPFRDDLLAAGRRRGGTSSRGRRWPPRHLAGGPAHPPGRDRAGHLRRHGDGGARVRVRHRRRTARPAQPGTDARRAGGRAAGGRAGAVPRHLAGGGGAPARLRPRLGAPGRARGAGGRRRA